MRAPTRSLPDSVQHPLSTGTRGTPYPQLAEEDYVEGEIRCPGCNMGVKMDGACNVITCRSGLHENGYYYFCAHCKSECPDGESYCRSCPHRNDRVTRKRVKAEREEFLAQNTAENPCLLDDSD